MALEKTILDRRKFLAGGVTGLVGLVGLLSGCDSGGKGGGNSSPTPNPTPNPNPGDDGGDGGGGDDGDGDNGNGNGSTYNPQIQTMDFGFDSTQGPYAEHKMLGPGYDVTFRATTQENEPVDFTESWENGVYTKHMNDSSLHPFDKIVSAQIKTGDNSLEARASKANSEDEEFVSDYAEFDFYSPTQSEIYDFVEGVLQNRGYLKAGSPDGCDWHPSEKTINGREYTSVRLKYGPGHPTNPDHTRAIIYAVPNPVDAETAFNDLTTFNESVTHNYTNVPVLVLAGIPDGLDAEGNSYGVGLVGPAVEDLLDTVGLPDNPAYCSF
jgi:hypothetical protein